MKLIILLLLILILPLHSPPIDSFINESDVVGRKYIPDEYQCLQFSDDMIQEGKEKNVTLYLGVINNHAIVVYENLTGYYFIDPQTGQILNEQYRGNGKEDRIRVVDKYEIVTIEDVKLINVKDVVII